MTYRVYLLMNSSLSSFEAILTGKFSTAAGSDVARTSGKWIERTLNNVRILLVVSSEKVTNPFNSNPTNCSAEPATTLRIAVEKAG